MSSINPIRNHSSDAYFQGQLSPQQKKLERIDNTRGGAPERTQSAQEVRTTRSAQEKVANTQSVEAQVAAAKKAADFIARVDGVKSTISIYA